jgi:hypothetical protein
MGLHFYRAPTPDGERGIRTLYGHAPVKALL